MSSQEPYVRSPIVTAGATTVAFVVVLVVLAVVSIIVGGIATLINYYMSFMRIEAAGFFGALIGGFYGVLASRMSCDAILKHYSKRSVFIFIMLIVVVGLYVEFGMMPLTWARLTPVAQLAVVSISGFVYFWADAEVDL
jgi:uncharacterized membrane protein